MKKYHVIVSKDDDAVSTAMLLEKYNSAERTMENMKTQISRLMAENISCQSALKQRIYQLEKKLEQQES